MSNENGRGRRALCFLLFLLALAVAGREAPEYIALSDDVSNDGALVSGVEQAVASIPTRRAAPRQRYGLGNRSLYCLGNLHPLVIHPFLAPPRLAGQKLLHMLSRQRK